MIVTIMDDELETKHAFICDKCDYKTNKESNYNKHLLTAKHRIVVSDTKLYDCSCGNTYKHRQGLWKHKSKHNCDPTVPVSNNELKDILVEILETIKQ